MYHGHWGVKMIDYKFIALSFYEQWYKEEVSPNLNNEEKLSVAKKISELSLREPIFYPGLNYSIEDFQELKSHSSTNKITGLQLWVLLTEIMKEFGANTLSASEVAKKEK